MKFSENSSSYECVSVSVRKWICVRTEICLRTLQFAKIWNFNLFKLKIQHLLAFVNTCAQRNQTQNLNFRNFPFL